MAKTAIADIIVPTEFENYTIERTAELSAFGQSGIVESDPAFDDLAARGGFLVDMPFWKDLSGDRQVLSDSRIPRACRNPTVTNPTLISESPRQTQFAPVELLPLAAKIITADDIDGLFLADRLAAGTGHAIVLILS